MSSTEKNLSEKESLQLITEMIGKAKSSYHSNGTSAILWGAVIFFCSVFNFIQLQFDLPINFDIWWLMFIALIPQLIWVLRNRKKKSFVSYEETSLSFVWWAFGAAILMMMFFNFYYKPSHSISIYLILFGLPTFITGGMFRFRPMIMGGVICWILFAISLKYDAKTGLLLMAIAALFAWLIPGIILRKKCSRAAQQ